MFKQMMVKQTLQRRGIPALLSDKGKQQALILSPKLLFHQRINFMRSNRSLISLRKSYFGSDHAQLKLSTQ